ncbi:hypothetical protein [Xanthomonas oryzae]|uniref:hypothetical protein n=1 Tax=Xanthomonas oryzae TaxID=347 RepID=UPI00104D6E7A|nr:hypothetical protein [Xanthomonas oryzae]QBG82771.1 hypothetical protein EYR27_00680 [Xanthomonas oryzae]
MDMSRDTGRLQLVCLFADILVFSAVPLLQVSSADECIGRSDRCGRMCCSCDVFFLCNWPASTSDRRTWVGSVVFRWSLLGIVVAMLGWALIARLGPWVWTEVFGDVSSEDVVIRSASGSLQCPHAVTVDPMPRGTPQRLCMLVGEAPDLGGGHGQAVIEGKRSAAGSAVRNLHLNATHQ